MAELRRRADILAAVQAGRMKAEEAYALLRAPEGPTPQPVRDDAIAVIGLAGRFPGAPDVEALWSVLEQGRDCVGEVPPSRWPLDGFYDPQPGRSGRSNSKWGGFLDDVAGFDAAFFGLSAREAELMDPQQRLFLMEAWHALEDAGHAGAALDGSRVGVFVGCAEGDYYDLVREAGRLYTPHAFMGAATAILAARIAYHLNLRGPALAVDTACSASLVSLHLACESLRRGECDMALAGGVYVMATPRLHLLASSAGMLSPTGRCHAFGASADGFVPAEAVGVVLLKPLSQALVDGDTVRAVIEASGTNQDGRTSGITAPSAPSQTALELDTYRRFGIDPASIGYIETHGTGTRLGDPIEVEALTAAFRRHTAARGFCRLGSAKSNLGHAQLAAGIVGFIKLVLALERGIVPPTLHAAEPNPELSLDDSPFVIAQAAAPWPRLAGGARRGAVSAFGFAGTNAHIVARAHEQAMPVSQPQLPACLVPLSGRDGVELADQARALLAWLERRPQTRLADIAWTLSLGRLHGPQRRALLVEDVAGLRRELLRLAQGGGERGATSAAREALEQQAREVLQRMPADGAAAGASYRKALEWLARAWEGGAEFGADWARLFLDARPRRIPLPGTAFRPVAYWVGGARADERTFGPDDPLPAAHRVRGRAVVPGAALLSAALAATGGELDDVVFESALTPREGERLRVVVRREANRMLLETPAGVAMRARVPSAGNTGLPCPEWTGPAPQPEAAVALYGRFAEAGLDYGEALRGLVAIARHGGLVRAEVVLQPRANAEELASAALDVAFQVAGALADADRPLPLCVLAGVGHLRVRLPLPERFGVLASGRVEADGGVVADLWLIAADGGSLGSVGALRLAPITRAAAALLTWRPVWREVEPGATGLSADPAVIECPSPVDGEDVEAALRRSLCGTLERAQELVRAGTRSLVQLHRDRDDAGEALAGLWRSVAAEYPDLAVVCLAVGDGVAHADARAAAAGLMPREGVVEARLSGDGRLARRVLEACELPSAALPAPASGCVVIAGGTGGIGRRLGDALARAGAHVALLGRSARDEGPRAVGGGQVLELVADVCDAAALERALERARNCFGTIAGVIHAAGVLDDALLTDVDPARALGAARVKSLGAELLDRLTLRDAPRWFVLFGALAGRGGNTGQAVYGYANRHLAAFARRRAARARTVVVDWPLWDEGGMRPAPAVLAGLARHAGLVPMPTESGYAVLAAAIASDECEVVVGYGDAMRLRAALESTPSRADAADKDIPQGLRERLLVVFAEAVAANLSVAASAVEAEAPLAEYGFDSISLTALADELNRSCGTALNPSVFFEVRTLAALADLAIARWPERIATALGGVAIAPAVAGPVAVDAVEPADAPRLTNARPVAPQTRDEPIAIVGIDLRFPGADDIDGFWKMLCDGVDPIREIPRERWDWRALDGDPAREPGRTNVRWGGFIDAIDRFDAAFFGIAPVEADAMDPQQRLLIESAWRAIEHAGHAPRALAGSRWGVFVGCAGYDYAALARRDGQAIEAYSATGIAPSLMSNRLSFLFDFSGPSETVDTACSSSLVALDRALRAIRSGACDAALVGAANAILTPDLHVAFSRAGMLDAEGRCRSFAASAGGYVRSEGVATVLLKPLSRALADGDTVHALLLGSAVNHGGRATSLTAPNAAAQAAVIRNAWAAAGVDAAQIGYVEAHGTGTVLGDPVEMRGLREVFDGFSVAGEPCLVGAVKSHVGHLEAVAGLAGTLAAAMAVREGRVPGVLHFDAPNPHLDLDAAAPVQIADRTRAWARSGARVAGVSSFGFGGTNAHVVLGEPPAATAVADQAQPRLIVLSARTEDDLARRVADLRAWLGEAAVAAPIEQVRACVAARLAVGPDDLDADEPLGDLGLDAAGLRALADDLALAGPGRPPPGVLGVDATLRSLAAAFAPRPERAVSLGDLAFTLACGRDAMRERLACVVSDVTTLRAVLAAIDEGAEPPVPVWRGRVDGASVRRRVASPPEPRSAARLQSLAGLWVDGAELPFAELFAAPRRRLALPPYRFAGARHWFGAHGGPVAASASVRRSLFVPTWQTVVSVPGAPPRRAVRFECRADAPLGARLQELRDALAGRFAELGSLEADIVVLPGTLPAQAFADAVGGLLAAWHAEEPRLGGVVWVGAPGTDAGDCPAGSVLRTRGAEVQMRRLVPQQAAGSGTAWREGARVLITGGTGGVGGAVAEHLARRYRAKLLLVGRRAQDAAIGARLDLLRGLGAEAAYLAVDLSTPDAAAAAIDEAVRLYGGLEDVVHAAGALADGLLSEAAGSAFSTVSGAKVDGLLALESVCRRRGFAPRMVLMSSLAGWLGNPGQAVYAAANRFLDAWAMERTEEGWPATSIAWSLWAEAGMRPPQGELARLRATTGLELLPTDAAVEALDAILIAGLPCAAVLWGANDAPARAWLSAPQPFARTAGPGRAADAGMLLAEVLGLAVAPGRDATLDEAGFSSLTAVLLRNRLRDDFGLDWPVAKLVGFDCIGSLLSAIDAAAPSAPVGSAITGSAPERDGPPAEGQRLLWLQHRLDPDGFGYHLPVVLELEPDADPAALERALSALLERHASLRTRFVERDGGPWRVVDAAQPVRLARLVAPTGGEAGRLDWLRAVARRPLRLAEALPVDFAWVEGMAERPWLLCRFHHIAVDGLSLRRLFDELAVLLGGGSLPPSASFGDFVAAERDYLASPQAETDRAFWRAHLATPPARLELPDARWTAASASRDGRSRSLGVEAGVRAGLVRASGQGPLFAVLAAAWAAVLARFVDDGRVRLLVPTAGRHEARFERCVGHCVNPLLVECRVEPAAGFAACRDRFRRGWDEAVAHARWPLAGVLRDLADESGRVPALAAVAHAGFYFQDWMGADRATGFRRLDVLRHEGEFPLVLEVIDRHDTLELVLKHDPCVIGDALAERLLDRLNGLLQTVAAGADDLVPLSRADAAETSIIAGWNRASHAGDAAETVSARVRRHALVRPEAVAVEYGEARLDYAALDAQADAVAAALRAAGVQAGEVVGVLMKRGIDLPASLVGVMRSAAAYLPLDAALPTARRDEMLADAGARVVLMRRADGLEAPAGLDVVTIDDAPRAEPSSHEPLPGALAYVLYTSGSTGRPKGVEVGHDNLARFLAAMALAPGLDADDRLLALTTVSFDISALELLLPLYVGGTTVVLDAQDARDATRLRRRLEAGDITVAQATPATWRMLDAAGWRGGGLRRALVGGESLPPDLAERLTAAVPEVWNVYGPTETTVWSTAGRLAAGERVTVGRPIAGTSCQVVDAEGEPCAIGVAGELWIAGEGVARGYRGQPGLTAERFVVRDGQRAYRSGDLARWLVDGRIEVLGRLDAQLKVRGYRVEPGEVEAAVVRRLGDRACVVMSCPREAGLDALTAVVVSSEASATLSPVERSRRLRAWLPDYMVPVEWRFVDALPLTASGKIDRRRLADAPAAVPDAAVSGLRPDTSGERLARLRALFAEVLGRAPEALAVDVPFGLLGVDSLRAVHIAEAATARLDQPLSPTDLFNYPDLASLAAELASRRPRPAPVPSPAAAFVVPGKPAVPDDAVAIIGMAGRFPDAPDLPTFWANLLAGRVSAREIPPERWDWRAHHADARNVPGRSYSRWAAFIDGLPDFDPAFFGMTPQEAACTDPQQRLMLMECWKALADTGRDPSAYAGSRCGVYVGATFGDYARLLEAAGEVNAFSMLGGGPSLIPARIAYHLDFKGPAVAVDTACSASLVAVHQACRALLAGETELALAGGVYLMCTPFGQTLSAAANILSPVGRCRPFSAEADGIVIGEAVGAVVLKRLADAIADGDPIRAVIRGSGVNQDGRSSGIAAPMAPAQAALVREVVERAGLAAGDLDYIETHGTGTRLGDPVELDGLRQSLGDADAPCHLGSVKANIGHSYQAAGIAGLIKTVLCLEQGLLPPQPGVGEANPLLRLDGSRFRIPRRAMPWPAQGRPRRAGVSSFGLSGTNAHVLLEAWPDAPDERPAVSLPFRLQPCWVSAPAPVAATATSPVETAGPASGAEPPQDDALRALVLDELAGLAGCAPQDVRETALLEADLGMDSIKLMGLLSRLGRVPGARAIDAALLPRLRSVADLLAAAGAEAPAVPKPDAAPSPARVVPMLDAQALFLLGHHLIDSSSLCSWLRLAGPFDRSRLQRAWQALVDANPGLRVILASDAPDGALGHWRAELLAAPTVPEPTLCDWSGRSHEAREAALAERFEAGLNRRWQLDRWPLHEISVVRLAPEEHALFLTNEHLVSDGIGNQLLLRRLLEHYAAEGGEGVPPAPLDDECFVAGLGAANASLPSTPPADAAGEVFEWNPAGRRIEAFVPRFANEVVEFDAARTEALRAAAGRLGAGLNVLLLVALLRASARTSGADAPTVQMPTAARVIGEVDAGDWIGCFAGNLSVSLPSGRLLGDWSAALEACRDDVGARLAEGEDLRQIRSMAQVIRRDVTLVHGEIPAALRPVFRARLRSNLYAPYIGETGIAPRYGALRVTAYRAGTVNGPATIDLLHEIFDGRLHASWNYDAAFFLPDEIARLRAAFEAELDDALAAAAAFEPPTDGLSLRALPQVLVDAVELVGGRRPRPDEADAPLEGAFGLDSLRRIRLLARLPVALRTDAGRRARVLGARTLADIAAVLAPEPAAEVPPLPLQAILHTMVERAGEVAVVAPDGTMRYDALDAWSAQLARVLRARGIGAGQRVGILLDRGRLLPAAILAVMRAGAAYVPLDPDYPAARLAWIVGHARLSALVSEAALASLLGAVCDAADAPPACVVMAQGEAPAGLGVPVLRMDAAVDAEPLPLPAGEDPMVVLYTSGSTGRPKGVVLDHRGYANRLAWHQRQFALEPGEAVLHKTTVCFDISVWELLWPLMNGGVLHVVDAATARDPWALAEVVRARDIVAMHFVPSMFGEFIEALAAEARAFPSLRWVVLSGEALPAPDVRRWFAHFGTSTRLANLYGPTEASIDVSCQVLERAEDAPGPRVPIGRAIDGVQLYVVDADLRPVPDGEQGELCIGGVQLAQAYHDAPELTARAFVPFSAPDLVGERVYRSGDLVCRAADGVIDYLGRIDSQVKLRGYRIELGEVEAVLRECEGVREAAVLKLGDGDHARLAAWVAAAPGLEVETVRRFCAARLPAWMVPASIERRDRLPRTTNGKLDRKALVPPAVVREAPLAPAQRWLVQHFPPPHAWWGYTRFICRRALEPSALERAYGWLVARHEALRTVYGRSADGRWVQQVLDAAVAERAVLRVIDVAALPGAQREAQAVEALRAACEGFDVGRWPLDAAIVLRHAEDEWAFCLANHHINGDFVSGDVLFREFWEAYEAFAAGRPAPDRVTAPTPADLAEFFSALERAGALAAPRAAWVRRLAGCGCFALPPNDASVGNVEAVAEVREFMLDAADTRALLDERRAALGLAVYPLLAAPLYAALAEYAATPFAVVSHRMAGRPVFEGADHSESVGNYAVHYPVRVDVDGADPATVAARVATALADAAPDGPLYDWFGAELGEAVYPDTRLTPVRLNYLGRLPDEVRGPFRFERAHHNQRLAPLDAPRSAELELHLAVRDDRLWACLGFARGRWAPERIETLLDAYRVKLQALARGPAARLSGRGEDQ